MWKPKLNRHFIFILIWNAVFHSLTLSILLYWALTSTRVTELNRMSTMNQFWSENQILFAALGSVAATLFFKDQWIDLWKQIKTGKKSFFFNFIRGSIFGLILILSLILKHQYEFLGFSVQLNLNFLTSYTWIFRSTLILLLILSNEFLVRVVLKASRLTELATFLYLYWIWFNPNPAELITLSLLYGLFTHFWSASGFLSGLFIMTHAVFGLPFFENEFLGLLQLKLLNNEDGFYQNRYLQLTLVFLLFGFKLIPKLISNRKSIYFLKGNHPS